MKGFWRQFFADWLQRNDMGNLLRLALWISTGAEITQIISKKQSFYMFHLFININPEFLPIKSDVK